MCFFVMNAKKKTKGKKIAVSVLKSQEIIRFRGNIYSLMNELYNG